MQISAHMRERARTHELPELSPTRAHPMNASRRNSRKRNRMESRRASDYSVVQPLVR
jgi:hypothetical protein